MYPSIDTVTLAMTFRYLPDPALSHMTSRFLGGGDTALAHPMGDPTAAPIASLRPGVKASRSERVGDGCELGRVDEGVDVVDAAAPHLQGQERHDAAAAQRHHPGLITRGK